MKFLNNWNVLRLLLLVFGILYLVGVGEKRLDSDEWQQMAMSVQVSRGKVLYRDIWDNHGPALTYLIAAPLASIASEDHSLLRWVRVSMFGFCLVPTVLAFAAWARRFFGQRETELGLFLLFSCWVLFQKGFEIRSDNPLNVLWMVSLLLWFTGIQKEKWPWFLAAGVALGFGFAFNIKTLILGFSTGLMFITAAFYNRRALLWMIPFGVGCAVGPLVTAFALHTAGNWPDFWASYVGENLDRPGRSLYEGYDALKDGGFYWTHLMLASIAYCCWMAFQKRLPKFAVILLPCAGFLVFQFLFLLPTVHYQSFLIALPPVVVLMSIAILDVGERLRARFSRVPQTGRNLVAVALVLLFAAGSVRTFRLDKLLYMDDQIEYANELQKIIPPDDLVLTGLSMPLFRDQPTIYYSLVEHLRYATREGLIVIDFPAVLAERDVHYVVYDSRIRDLDQNTNDFIRDNYIPLRLERLRGAGRIFRSPADAGQQVAINIAGEYWWRTQSADGKLLVNGVEVPNPVRLEDGSYELSWTDSGALVMCVEPPEEWLPEADPRRAAASAQ